MKRLLLTSLITIVIGIVIFITYELFFIKENVETSETEQQNIEQIYEFDISYAKKVAIEELKNIIEEEETILIFIGKEEEEATKKISTILSDLKDVYKFNLYYLEKESGIEKTLAYQDLLTSYPDITNYINFTPVILAFKNNQFIAGIPGGVEQKNIVSFLEYIETLE